ncbi:MAG: hypothetical protein A2509_09865 [Candidatus Edwardsbacteria bacterium RIFOXYD12_FULL_50_11]|jgi:putative endonuclease|uniref:GIY-YIG domain-containing protein n=1 Tax=Candidatus Edwardsbacteria bacterium GWF2_54_11 TaxID=1817851 RepID=A0A1F5R765_9BACT|nr:MAG: hypothetical protein A2502_11670 [Candidatus Edwardsbacteria bacterium RifOxyC12_full_54_24]OGF08249.1 MAG: hypothetical protein A2273_07840 [Candidatus Edwardsbacteria bacterium RifOxyA12_full_54_48]OGF10300.1 MAG: hypothetical protein A2024_02085 [Candidatus Edwardsbacteria bacterium GWF2_54_11]OGF11546.1 MAG: hypothetical protein A3K15_04310 [Candidatus Edwardsbacteria bacterium GWE2_54_12]OGF17333.1 MAG: hypothetical protein A2509_09865 [Candidatus Edwardsbacteria bacterium RIFOXYD1
MSYFVYVLKSISVETRYIGSSADINERLVAHNNGKCKYTRNRRPWVLVYSEEFATLADAMKRERYLKTGQGREFLDKVIK